MNIFTRFTPYARMDFYEMKPGESVPLHDHPYMHETMVLLGEVDWFDDTGAVVKPLSQKDDTQIMPLGVKHGFRAKTDALLLNITDVSIPAYRKFVGLDP